MQIVRSSNGRNDNDRRCNFIDYFIKYTCIRENLFRMRSLWVFAFMRNELLTRGNRVYKKNMLIKIELLFQCKKMYSVYLVDEQM